MPSASPPPVPESAHGPGAGTAHADGPVQGRGFEPGQGQGVPPVGGPPALPPAAGGYQSTVVPSSYPPIPLTGPPPVPASAPMGYPPVVSPQPGMSGGTKALLFGCIGLVLLVGVLLIAGMMWAGRAVKGIAQDLTRNPTRFAAEMIVKGDPGLEIAGSDDTNKTVTVRNKKTGEETTFSLKDLEQGKMVMKRSDGTTAELGPAGFQLRDKDGNVTDIGGGGGAKLPDWVPSYPGDHTVGVFGQHSKNGQGQERGTVACTMTEDVETVAGTYRKALENAGFQVAVKDSSATGAGVVMLEAKGAAEGEGNAALVPTVSAQIMSGGQGSTVMTLKYEKTPSGAQ